MAEYKQTPYRYINLIVYILAALANSLPVHTFSSINSSVEKAFDYSKQIVTSFALIFTILHPIGAFPANWILDKYGSQKGCLIGSIFVIAGVWLRTLMQVGQPQWVIIGSFLAAFGNLFVLNSAIKVAVNWFNPSNIPNVIFIAVLANQVSMTLGASLPGLILPNNPSAQSIKQIVFVQAIVISAPLVLLMILYRDKPQIPPSKSASKAQKKQDYSTLLKKLFSNKQYMKILFGMMVSYGTQIAFIATLDQILKGLGYSDSNETTALTILCAMLIGIVATPVFSTIIKKTKKYKLVTILNVLGCYVFLGLATYVYVNGWEDKLLICIVAGLAGFFLIPNLSLYLAYSAQAAFPIGQGSAGGYLFAAGQTFGFLLGFLIIKFLDKSKQLPSQMALISFQILLMISMIFIAWTKQDLKRLKYQKHRRSSIGDSGQNITSQNLQDSLILPR